MARAKPNALAAILSTLSDTEARTLAVAMFNGAAPSFDPGIFNANGIVNIFNAWMSTGAVSPDTIALHAAHIVSQRYPQAPAAPIAPAMPAPPAVQAYGGAPVAIPIPTFIPQASPLHQAIVAAAHDVAPVEASQILSEPAPAASTAPDQEIVLPRAADTPHVVTHSGAAQRVNARTLFADQPAHVVNAIPPGLSVMVYNSPDAPAINPIYMFDAGNLTLALSALACTPSAHAWLGGPRGTGKTEFARQIAARLGRAFFRVNFNRSTEGADLLGDMGLANGATHWVDGPVSTAMRTPGAILLLDEPTYGAQGHIASLNPVLERDGAAIRLPRTGERLQPAQDVAVYLADNTFGHGDTSGEYIARAPMGSDTLDRVALFLQFDYMPEATERAVLSAMVRKTCGVAPPKKLIKDVCKLMHVARSKADAGELTGAPSLRRACAFAVALVQGIAAPEAFAATVVMAAPPDSQETLRQIYAATWPHNSVSGPSAEGANPFAHTPGDAGSI